MDNGHQQPMKMLLSDLGTLRGRIFFWLGLLILPVFWVWWMRPAYFSRWQRQAGLVWTVCYLILLFVFSVPLEKGFGHLQYTFPSLTGYLTVGLGIWLVLRFFRWSLTVILIGVFSLGGPLGLQISQQLSHSLPPMMPSPVCLTLFICPALVAVLHLFLEPGRHWLVALIARNEFLRRHALVEKPGRSRQT